MEFIEVFLQPSAWIALITLAFLEIVLGIDNIVFLSIVTSKLPKEQQPKARRVGLLLAMVFRIALLFGISLVLKLTKPIFTFDISWIDGSISGQSIIVFVGGLFLLYKSVTEIHHKLEGEDEANSGSKAKSNFTSAIVQIVALDIVFSFDSVLTAIGLVSFKEFGYAGAMSIMVTAVVFAVMVMLIFAEPVSKFVNNHPTIQILGLSFLILIGVMLITEASHLSHLRIFDSEVGAIPKGYLYFAIAFSLFVEFINLKMGKKKSKPVHLHDSEIVNNKK
ncbi:TerC family protein [Apibacter raozihei]|uniref:TerC family protein n=1 Tax=Apibacter TaxID=1778601 RepID=UPI000FE34878|nr:MULTISPECIES: TerC family protein [Apibacter]